MIVIFFIGLWYFYWIVIWQSVHTSTPLAYPTTRPACSCRLVFLIDYIYVYVVVQTLSRVRKGENFPDIPIFMKESYVWQNMLLQNKTYLMYDISVFQIIRTLCKSSGHFEDHPQIFYIIWFLLRPSGSIWMIWKFLNIPDTKHATQQDLSRFAKTFWSSLLTRWWGFCDSDNECTLYSSCVLHALRVNRFVFQAGNIDWVYSTLCIVWYI